MQDTRGLCLSRVSASKSVSTKDLAFVYSRCRTFSTYLCWLVSCFLQNQRFRSRYVCLSSRPPNLFKPRQLLFETDRCIFLCSLPQMQIGKQPLHGDRILKLCTTCARRLLPHVKNRIDGLCASLLPQKQ